MNYYLYVDNFRGFADTCVPITDVNFFVGENSTGKSSLLGLLKLFSGPAFLMSETFASEEVGFGHFFDMVSAHSEDQSYFDIGFVAEFWERKKKRSEKVVSGCLFTFREQQGQPRLFKCSFYRDKEEITLQFGNSVYFKTNKCEPIPTARDLIDVLRLKWRTEHSKRKDASYTKLPVPRGMGSRLPVIIALSLASRNVKQPKKSGELVLFPPSMGFAPPDITWFGPIRTKAKRTYDELSLEFSPEGQHTPYLIRRMLNSKTQANRLRDFIEKVGKASGLFQDVRIKNFGRGATARFELDIVLDDKALNILNVGYGVSQSLPIIVELLARSKGTWFAIQEPEIHLHPRAQAALGDVLFEMAALDRKRFLVETHSDFTIDRFRMNYKRSKRADRPDSQILFFERQDKRNVVRALQIGETGELPVDQPDSYRSFFVREQMDLLGI